MQWTSEKVLADSTISSPWQVFAADAQEKRPYPNKSLLLIAVLHKVLAFLSDWLVSIILLRTMDISYLT